MAQQMRSSWPQQSAVVLSHSLNIQMLLKELLRTYGWSISVCTSSFATATASVEKGQATIIIVDDTVELPSVIACRRFLGKAVTASTPILSFLMDSNKLEQDTLARIGIPMMVPKPLTPSKFVPGFLTLLRKWDTPGLRAMRGASYQITAGNIEHAIRIFGKLCQDPTTEGIAAIPLSLCFRQIGKLKAAETTLISALKKQPKNLGLMLSLGDLYMHSCMPQLAHRLFAGAHVAYPRSLCMLPDLVQSALAIGGYEEARTHLHHMIRAEFLAEECVGHLSRVLLADGREFEAETLLQDRKGYFRKFQRAWEEADASQQAPGTESQPKPSPAA